MSQETISKRPRTVIAEGESFNPDNMQRFSFGYTEGSTVDQDSLVQNTINQIDNSQGLFSGLGADGANTIIVGLLAISFLAIVGFGIAAKFKKKKK